MDAGIDLLTETSGAAIMISPVTAETGIANGGSVIGRMQKLSAACVDAHMGNTAGICIFKENQISGSKVAAVNGSAHAVLASRGPWGRIAHLT